MSVRVKICGVTLVEDAVAAATMGADFIGLNFHPPSPRFVTLKTALAIRRELSAGSPKVVGVFVNAARAYIVERVRELALEFVQLHGDETATAAPGLPVGVIKALWAAPGISALQLEQLLGRSGAHYNLIDSYDPVLYGGTGRSIDPGLLARLDLRNVLIAGGLQPDNVRAVARLRPYAVDVASGVESAPGVKDHRKLRDFITNAKAA